MLLREDRRRRRRRRRRLGVYCPVFECFVVVFSRKDVMGRPTMVTETVVVGLEEVVKLRPGDSF